VVAFDLPEHRFTAQSAVVYVRPNDELAFAETLAALMDDPVRRRHGQVRTPARGNCSGLEVLGAEVDPGVQPIAFDSGESVTAANPHPSLRRHQTKLRKRREPRLRHERRAGWRFGSRIDFHFGSMRESLAGSGIGLK